MVQNIVGNDTVDLGTDVTYLSQTTHQTANAPYVVVLPNGNYQRQIKRIFILGSAVANTAPFTVTGTFAACTSLSLGILSGSFPLTAVVLEWDGGAWHVIGGNPQLSQSAPLVT